jgi:hypothetical protein
MYPNGSSRLAKQREGNATPSDDFSAHGFKRICQADDHDVMVTKRALLRQRIARNSYVQQRFP